MLKVVEPTGTAPAVSDPTAAPSWVITKSLTLYANAFFSLVFAVQFDPLLISATTDDSELAMVVREENAGWVVLPDNVDGIVNVILQAKSAPQTLAEMSTRARTAVEKKYSYLHTLKRFQSLIESLASQAKNTKMKFV